MAQYDEDTFELDDTPVEDSENSEAVEEPEVLEPKTAEPLETEEVAEPVEEQPVETPVEEPTDNWEVRARYQQSEADKFRNIAEQQNAQLQQVLDAQKPKEVKAELPQAPETDDPDDSLRYTVAGVKYLLKDNEETKKENQDRERQAEEFRQQSAQKDRAIGDLTKVTKSPEKAQKILGFFADKSNLQDPALYNVMYDAAMSYANHKPSAPGKNPKTPPPPTGGGEEPDTGKKTPDDEFNEQLGQENDRYRL